MRRQTVGIIYSGPIQNTSNAANDEILCMLYQRSTETHFRSVFRDAVFRDAETTKRISTSLGLMTTAIIVHNYNRFELPLFSSENQLHRKTSLNFSLSTSQELLLLTKLNRYKNIKVVVSTKHLLPLF
jgi:hypothetical protein